MFKNNSKSFFFLSQKVPFVDTNTTEVGGAEGAVYMLAYSRQLISDQRILYTLISDQRILYTLISDQ
jgi:hypothetical protein